MKKIILLLFSISLINSCSSGSEEPPPPPIKYTLTTAANPTAGGTVTPASGQHNEDATVNITATPAGEYIFSSWTGATGTTASTSVVMNSNKTVTANFIKKKYALTITVEGEGTVAEKVIKAGLTTDYNSGTIVELTATPADDWEFKEWKGDVTGTDNPIQITIDKAKTVKAVFESIPPFYLDENGVTIKARDGVTAGTTGELGGVTYTAVDNATLKIMADNDEDVTKVVTTVVTDMKELFKDKLTFNQDIGSWDVSSVTSMSFMFQNAQAFNQDLSKWCVTNIASEPQDFSVSSALSEANKPIWGTCPSSGSNIWTGTNMTFTKGDQSDPTLESNQDRITDNVWITRPNKKEDGKNGYGQIYNIKEESKPDENNSPVGTKWAVGTIDQIGALTFKKFRAAVGKPKNVVGKNLVMYLEKDDVYLTVKFTSWSQGEKGGFAYERSTKP